ncbi:murein transglycosylase [Podospora conica]|nr:murein transglycosylase [Schizothecium conicum]
MLFAGSIILPGLLASLPVRAQTFTDCNPIHRQCPSKPGLPSTSYAVDFTKGPDPGNWEHINTGSINFTPSGAELTIAKQGDNPTLQTAWYFLFGRAEVRIRSAPGRGIITAVVLESDDLDEIDWEWLGGTPNEVQTNYFGKGNTSIYDRGAVIPTVDTQTITHIYTMDWSPEAIQWSLDGVVVRTLAYEDANGGENYPQTPMRLKLGIWAGGDPGNPNGTIQWAGGPTDFQQAPFTMYVERVSITNDAPAISYSYGDFSGDWESIVVEPPPGGRAPEPVVAVPTVNAALVPENNITAAVNTVPAPESDSPAPENTVPAQEDVDEIQAEGPIEEDDDDMASQEEDADGEVEETDAAPALPRRLGFRRLVSA